MRRLSERGPLHCVSTQTAKRAAHVLSGKGLKTLSTKIADLRDLVTLASSYSPTESASTITTPLARNQLSNYPHLSPGIGHPSANTRSFLRTASAPASSAHLHDIALPRISQRASSGLNAGGILLASSTLTEMSEDLLEIARVDARALLASPPLPVKPVTPPAALGDRNRSFGRSKSGRISLGLGGVTIVEKLAVMDISIYAGLNALTSCVNSCSIGQAEQQKPS